VKGIVGYTVHKQGKTIQLERSFAGVSDYCSATTFDAVVDWLTVDYPNSFHVVWNLQSFADAVFSLLPRNKQEELEKQTKVFVGDIIKIFFVDRFLGITTTKHVHGNFVERHENNFFGISNWLPSGTSEPTDALGVAKYGEDIVSGLERMGIVPDKLTSPVGVLTDELRNYDLPTVYSNEAILDPADYCLPMMRREWRSAIKIGFFDKTYSYDMRSAYPSIIAELPNTDKCRITKSDHYVKSHWAICKGIMEVDANISPIVCDFADTHINPKGKLPPDFYTKDEINWVLKHGVGKFTLTDGYFIDWLSSDKPYREFINRLFAMRDTDDKMVNNLARKASQGISGKLDQDNSDGTLGEFYNPIYASICRSRCRLRAADFIYDNSLLENTIAIQVDGVLADKEVAIGDSGKLGSWRLDTIGPALVISRGEIWKPGKKPLNISYDRVMETIKSKPNRKYYVIDGKYISLNLPDVDRKYDSLPRNGNDLLNNVYPSHALEIP